MCMLGLLVRDRLSLVLFGVSVFCVGIISCTGGVEIVVGRPVMVVIV